MIHLAAILVFSSQVVVSGQVVGTGPQTPPRDRVPPPRVGTGVVKGRVVDGTTGAPIARARVMMQGVGGGAPATTDGDGSFSFTGLPTGPVMLMVQKSTYLMTRYPTAGRTIRSQTRPLILRDGQVLDNLVVKLFHGGSISGRILDANGDVLDNAQVSLLRVPSGGRTGKPTMAQGTSTNDLGEYRIGRLEAGTYLVQVTARREGEMYMPSNGAPPPPPASQPLPTFYPSALALEQAQPIAVERGQAITDIDVVLAEGVPGIVTGTVLTADGQPVPPNTYPSINVRRVMSDKVPGWYDYGGGGVMSRPDGTFRAVMPPGDYMIEARLMNRNSGGGPPRPDEEQIATARVSVVPGGEESLTLVVGPGATATGRVIFEGTSPAPPSPGRVRVPLTGEGGTCRGGEAEVAADWSFKIQGLSGTCSAQPMGFFGRWTLKSVIINGDNVVDSPVTFQPGQKLRNVQIVVTDRRSSMTFQVADDNGQATREYVVLAYPVDKDHWTNGARIYMPPVMMNPDAMRTTANLPGGGSAVMRPQMLGGLRAGDYYVVAVDDLESDDIRDPAVLDKLRSSATRVTVAEGATVELSLRRGNFAEIMRQQ